MRGIWAPINISKNTRYNTSYPIKIKKICL